MSIQCDIVRSQQARELLAPEKSMFVLALGGERVEADQGVIDEAGMAHDEAALRQAVEKLSHQGAEIRPLREIVGAGESRIKREVPPRGAGAKLAAQAAKH